MNKIYLLLGEFDGRKWEHTIETELYSTREYAREALREKLKEIKKDLLEFCDEDDIEMEFCDEDAFQIQSDDFDHWADYAIKEMECIK